MLAVYGRVVTWKHLILTATGIFLLMGAASVGVAWWAWQNLAAQVVLKEQDVRIRLPEALAVEAAVSQQVQVRVIPAAAA